MRHTLLLAIAAAAVLSPDAAFARTNPPSVRVSYADLNLSTESGRERFDRRLVSAVKRVCPAGDPRDLVARRFARTCAAETHANLKQTVASIMNKHGVALASVAPSDTPTAR